MKLIRLLVAVLALSLAFGAGAASADAAKKKPNAAKHAKQNKRIAKQAKRICKKKKARAKRKCVRKQKKRLRAKAKRQAKRKAKRERAKRLRERKRALNNPRVTIRTTEYGIPRIIADDWRGLGFGYGFALARENICSMADIYTTVRGERSRYFGPDGTWQLTGNGIEYTNLESDFAHKRVIAEKAIPEIMGMKPPNGPKPQVKQVIDGYVKGYNRYLKNVGVDKLPDASCRGAEWVKPITKLDAYLRFYELGTMAGLGAAVDGTANAAPPFTPAAAKAADAAAPTAADFRAMNERNPDIGSNAVGLGSDATSTGKGLLYGNPHFPWSGSERFFQSQLTIPGKINVSGGSLLGTPVVLIGHTQNLAWSHTVSTARRFNFVQEQLVPGNPTAYMVDGKAKPMTATKVTVAVKQPDGSVANETRTLYSTEHGPIATSIQKTPLFAWSNSNAYALNDPNSKSLRFINHFFDTNRAQSVRSLEKILKETIGVPWVNTIAADSNGEALYADVGTVPNLTDARVAECNVPGIGDIAWQNSKVAVLDGSTSSCDMQQAPGAPASGILGPDQMPLQIRRDYTSNMNDSYWLSNPADRLEGYPSIIGNEKSARSLRTRNGLNQIEQRLAGTDGQEGNKYTPTQLLGFINNNRHYGGELFIPTLVTYCQANPTINGVDVSAACNVLANWDRTENLDSKGAYLARRVIGRIQGAGSIYTTPFDLSDPVHTPSGLNTANTGVPKALADSVTEMNGLGIPLDATWRDYQFVTKAGEKIPIPGGPGGQGVFNVITAQRNASTGEYDSVVHGSSFIIMASMTGEKCPDVKTILTYSQAATNEASPHYKDQTKLFSNGQWVQDRFCAAEQKQSPGVTVRKLNGGAKAVNRGW